MVILWYCKVKGRYSAPLYRH